MKINSPISAKAIRHLSYVLTFLIIICAQYFSMGQDSLKINTVKGTYYIRVSTPHVSTIPLCNPSNVTSVLAGSDALKRICRYSGVYRITRPFTGLEPSGLGDTLGRYFRIDFSDTTVHRKFRDSLLTLSYIEIVEGLPVMKNFGRFAFPNDKYTTKQWNLEKVKGFQAHDHSTGNGITIAVVDDAFDLNHEDLKGSYYVNSVELNGSPGVDDDGNGYTDDIRGWDASDDDNDPNNYGTTQSTMKYHGTMVAGVIAATPNNLKGVASIAPDVKIIPIKVSSDSFAGNPLTHTLEGLLYAIKSPAKIINLSWGGEMHQGEAQSSLLHLLVQSAYFNNKIIVTAAGNGHYPQGAVTNCINIGRGKAGYGYSDILFNLDSVRIYPAAFNEVFSVGATSSNDQKACFSDYGTMSLVDIMAPGEDIPTTFPFNNYTPAGGTSFAAPLVAGVCALVWNVNPLYTKIGVIGQILGTADDITEVNQNIASKIGAGRVNALDAVLNRSVKAMFKVEGQQSGCDGTTFRFLADSFAGYTYIWSYNDGTPPVTGLASQYKTFYIPLSTPDILFDVTLTIKNAFGIVVSTLTRSKYILVSKCSTNRINNKRNQWMFAYQCSVEFGDGIAKQSSQTSSLPKHPLQNFTILHKDNSNIVKYAAGKSILSYNPTLFYNDGSTSLNTFEINYKGSGKFFNMYVPLYRNLQGEFFNVDNKRTIFISNYDTNLQTADVGLRFAIIRDSSFGGLFEPYIKDLQKGIPITGPIIADLTTDGALRVEHGMAFIPRCDNQTWMIVKGASGVFKDSLLVYLINTSPGALSITFQESYTCPPLKTTDIIRANRYGTMIVCGSEKDSNLVVFDFKRSTGKLTLKHYFGLDYRYKLAPVFSKFGNILYLADYEGLKQINLDYKNPSDHIVKIYSDNYLKNKADFWFAYDNGLANNPMYGIQIGPDGRVYTNFPSDMYPAKRMGMVAQPDKFFYNSYGSTYENYLPIGLKFNNYTYIGGAVSTHHGMTEYQHASECNSLPVELFSSFVSCNVVRLYTNSCTPLKKWFYYDSVTHITHWRYADEYLVYLDSFPTNGVVLNMIDGPDTLHRLIQQPVLPPSSLIASASSTCSREVPVNYKFSHSILNQTDIFVKDWSIMGGEIFRYLGDSAVDVVWNGEGVQGTLKAVVMHPLNGCKDSIIFTIIKKPAMKIRPFGLPPYRYDSAVIAYDSIFYLTLNDTGYRPIYTSYKWFKDGVKLSYSDTTKRILVIEPGTYRVVADGPCGPDSSNKLVVSVICNTFNDFSNTTLSGGLFLNQVFTFDGQIQISGPYPTIFENCILYMKPCSSFEVYTHFTSDTLIFLNTKIIGCAEWQGIRVRGPINVPRTPFNCGYLSMADCSIENAIIAVSAEDGGEVNLNNNRFTNNELHIAFNDYPHSHNALLMGNSFGRLKPSTYGCSHPFSSLLTSRKTNPMVYFQKVKDISFINNSFEGKNVYSLGNLSNMEAQEVNSIDMHYNDFYSEADFGVHIWNSTNSNLLGNHFNDQSRYIPNYHTGLGITKTGLRAKSCSGLGVGNNNVFWCCNNGIEWYDSINRIPTSNVLENTFKGCNNGFVFAQQVNPLTNLNGSYNTSTSYDIAVDINCNLFESDSVGIVGSGVLKSQGTSGTGVRNKFVNNYNWDMVHQNYFSYFSYPALVQYRPDSSNSLLKRTIMINNANNGVFIYRNGGLVLCSNGLFVLKTDTSKISNTENIIIFPNPISQTILNIVLSDTGNASYTLNNALGQLLCVGELMYKQNSLSFNYATGIYFLSIRQGLTTKHFKLIKQ